MDSKEILEPYTLGDFKESDIKDRVVDSGLFLRKILTIVSTIIMLISTICTYCIIFLQGFKYHEFSLPESFLNWLGAATIGTLISNTVFIYKNIYDSRFIEYGKRGTGKDQKIEKDKGVDIDMDVDDL